MSTKEFLKKVFGRYTSVGLSLMGIYNIALLVLYFTHRIEAMLENVKLIGIDILLVLGATLAGLVWESIQRIRHKKSRPDDTGGK